MMNALLRKSALMLIGVVLLGGLLAGGAVGFARVPQAAAALLPPSDWWLVTHDQCDDTLHWINPSGEFASIPRPQLPDEAPEPACAYRAMHISQDGRYLVQSGMLNNGRVSIGFYDLQTGLWLQVHQAQPDEFVYLGHRYSSDSANRIAVGFANAETAVRAWRVIVFDMTTGDVVEDLRSDGAEIAGFVGGEFLATAAVSPYVQLLSVDDLLDNYHVLIRFDTLEEGADPLGAIAWYPLDAPGVTQEIVSSPYASPDMDILPNGKAIFAHTDAAFSAGPPFGVAPFMVETNAISMLLPDPGDVAPEPQLFYADGTRTFFEPQWLADGDWAVFRSYDGMSVQVNMVRIGTAMMTPLDEQATQIIGLPFGYVYSTASGIYYLTAPATEPEGPVFSDPALSGSMAFVWATAFGNPTLALDTPMMPIGGPPSPGVSGGPDLFVSEFSLTPATPVKGQPVEVRVGVYNQGDTAVSGNFTVEWYPGESYPSPGCNWSLDGMAAGGGRILTCIYAGYPSAYSSINTLVKVDSTNAIVETNETNNSYIEPLSVTDSAAPPAAGQPDLFVSEFSLNPATPVQGQPVEVRVGVYNGGTAAASGTFTIEWYPGEGYSSPGCNWSLDSMAAGGGRILTCTYAGYPSAYASINTLVMVDTANVIAESNEANNGYTLSISVTAPAPAGQPDLFVSEFSLNPATPVQGQPVEVRVGVYNQGSAAASGNFSVEWYPGENYASSGCNWSLDGMAAGGGRILTCTYAGYPSAYGSINTRVIVDTTNAIAESNEGNNVHLQGISVTAPAPAGQPDLFVSEFSLTPATPVKGQPVEVRVGVYNQGSAAASGNFSVEWYPGENYASPGCNWSLDGMTAGGGRILTCTYAGYPSAYGSINTKVIVDTTNAIAESNEGNNVHLQSISVSSP